MVARQLLISGRVQGVFYRASTQQKAQALGLRGWVRNLPDGRVAAFVQGGEVEVRALIAWCHEGPPMAAVDEVEVRDVEVDESLTGFVVRN